MGKSDSAAKCFATNAAAILHRLGLQIIDAHIDGSLSNVRQNLRERERTALVR